MPRRRRPLAFLAVLFALSLAALPLAAGAASSSSGITTIGYGMASAPAETAAIQFSVVDYNYNPAIAQQDEAQVRATIKPVLDALAAAGVNEGDVELIVGPRLVELTKYEGPALALVRIMVENPTTDQVAEILAAATSGATAARLSVGTTGVRYEVADCAALDRAARDAAIADARARAQTQADLLGLELGEVVGSRDLAVVPQTAYGPYGPVPVANGCTPAMPTASYGTTTLPPFDPSGEAEVTLYAQIELTWEITFPLGATPAA